MPFHRQQPATASKLGAVYEHEGMSVCVCAELQLDNTTVTRCFNACLSPSLVVLLPRCLSVWSWLDLELLVGCRLFTGLTLISVSCCFDARHVLCVFALSLAYSCCSVSPCFYPSLDFIFGVNPTDCGYIFLCQTHHSSALTSQHRSRWWRMTWQPSHCCSLLTQRRSPAVGGTAERSWSKVIQGCVMAL